MVLKTFSHRASSGETRSCRVRAPSMRLTVHGWLQFVQIIGTRRLRTFACYRTRAARSTSSLSSFPSPRVTVHLAFHMLTSISFAQSWRRSDKCRIAEARLADQGSDEQIRGAAQRNL